MAIPVSPKIHNEVLYIYCILYYSMYTGTLAILSTCPLTSPKVSDRPVEMSLSQVRAI